MNDPGAALAWLLAIPYGMALGWLILVVRCVVAALRALIAPNTTTRPQA
jgi:hypothetical protein